MFFWNSLAFSMIQWMSAMKTSHRKLIKLITLITALSNSMKPWAMLIHIVPPKTDGSWWRILTKHGPLEKRIANHFSILALRTPWTEWKGKKYDTERWTPQVSRYPIWYWRKTPERMKRWSQCKNNIQLLMWLVKEARSNGVKRNIA